MGEKKNTKSKKMAWCFFIHCESNGISSRVSVYIIAVGVYHQPQVVYFRNDDIQNFVLMICNSFGIDDIQGIRLDFKVNFI